MVWGAGYGEKPGHAICIIFVIVIFTPALGKPACCSSLQPQVEETFYSPLAPSKSRHPTTPSYEGLLLHLPRSPFLG